MIPVEELEIGAAYYGDGRNFDIAIWDGKLFQGVRQKFDDYFISGELHYETDNHFGTFKPYEKLEPKGEK